MGNWSDLVLLPVTPVTSPSSYSVSFFCEMLRGDDALSLRLPVTPVTSHCGYQSLGLPVTLITSHSGYHQVNGLIGVGVTRVTRATVEP